MDRIAPAALGHLVRMYPRPLGAHMRLWARDEDIWRRRSAILCQLSCKSDTDLARREALVVRLPRGCGSVFWPRRVFRAEGDGLGIAHVCVDGSARSESSSCTDAHAARLSHPTRREALKNLSGVSG